MDRKLATEYDRRLLHLNRIRKAVINKDHKELKLVLSDANANVINSMECFGELALDVAARQADLISVKLLLAYGAIPDYKRPRHVWPQSTLSLALLGGNQEIIKLLSKHGCDPDAYLQFDRKCALEELNVHTHLCNYWYIIIQSNDPSLLQCLLDCKDRKIDNDDEWSQMMLLKACKLGSDAIVEYLLDQGVSIESSDGNGWTGVFYAIACKRISTLWLLMSRSANLKHKDLMGRNLLHVIAYRDGGLQAGFCGTNRGMNFLEVVQLLIDQGIEINARDNDGLTPINTIFSKYYLSERLFFLFLQQPDIDITIPDKYGMTVLHRIVNVSNSHVIYDLVGRLDINTRDLWGRTALQLIDYPPHIWNFFDKLLDLGTNTDVLHHLNETMYKNIQFFKFLAQYKVKRKIAGFSKDENIEAILNQYCISMKIVAEETALMFSEEIQRMKKTLFFGQLSCYDFLHAKKRTLISLAKKAEIRERFKSSRFDKNFRFLNYRCMLMKNYLSGIKPLTSIESEAITFANKNLDAMFNYKLPSLIIYNIKKYIDIEDMVSLNNVKSEDEN